MSDKPKILVAEDNDFVRMQIVKFLQDAQFDTIECTDGQQALNKMQLDVALAIVDVRMEPMGGFDFIRAIRGDDNLTPVILVTGDQNPDLLNESSKWNISAVLMKPVQKDRLVKTVERTLKIKRAS